MRVAMVVPTFPQVSETFIVNKALGLADRGVDVQLVCGSSPAASWAAFGAGHRVNELADRVHVTPGATWNPAALRSTAGQIARLVTAPRSVLGRYVGDRRVPVARRARDLVLDAGLIDLEPDVVHFEFGSLAPDRMALRERLGVAVTVSFRGYDLNYVGLGQPDFYRSVWEHADGIHLLGEDLWRRAVRRGAPPDAPRTFISPAIDTSGITPTPARSGKLGGAGVALHVLSIGRLHWKKGYDDALEAIARLHDQGVSVEHRIVGDGDLLSAVAFWRHQLGLDDQVELLRSVPPAEVARQLGWADVVLHAATSEGFCNAVIEAQAHGVPVVCSDADGLPENVDDDVTGVVVPRRDPAALAAALTRLAADGDLRARMGAAGRDRVERLFRLDDQIDAWVRFYQDAITRRSAVGAR